MCVDKHTQLKKHFIQQPDLPCMLLYLLLIMLGRRKGYPYIKKRPMISAVHITEWRCGFKLHQLYTLIAMHNRTLVARVRRLQNVCVPPDLEPAYGLNSQQRREAPLARAIVNTNNEEQSAHTCIRCANCNNKTAARALTDPGRGAALAAPN